MLAAVVAALLAAHWHDPNPSDLLPTWQATRALWQGQNPYALVGPAGPIRWPWPLMYPATTLALFTPFALLPFTLARLLFAAVSAGVLAYAIFATNPNRWPMLLSWPVLFAFERGQWSPLILAGFLWAPASIAFVAKPTLGGAAWLARPRLIAALTGVLLVGGTLLVLPTWPRDWITAAGQGETIIPIIAIPGAWLVLLALVAWRDATARLLVLSLCVPQTFMFYEAVYPFAVPTTRTQTMTLAVLSYIPLIAASMLPDGLTLRETTIQLEPWLIAFGYLPAAVLLMLPHRRPVVA